MNTEQQLKLQAFLDGELPEKEARDMANWIARDPDAAALQAELRNTRQALSGFEASLKLPESREFYWSKIQREIQRTERAERAKPATSPMLWWRRLLIPVTAVAVVAIAVLLALPSPGSRSSDVVTVLADPGALTFRDEKTGVTMVWLSYGAEKGLANGHSTSTLQ